MLYKRIIKEGCATEEELAYEEHFYNSANKAKIYNERHPRTRRWKRVVQRKSIPIYSVDIKTKEILNSFPNMIKAGESINMAVSNFSREMADRPIYTPVCIKGVWFIKQSHYENWKNK